MLFLSTARAHTVAAEHQVTRGALPCWIVVVGKRAAVISRSDPLLQSQAHELPTLSRSRLDETNTAADGYVRGVLPDGAIMLVIAAVIL